MPSAGDVERYAYCAHNWWLSRGGENPVSEGSKRGVREHTEKQAALDASQADLGESRRALRWALRLLAAAASLTILTLETMFFEASPQDYVLVSAALVVAAGSVALLVIGLLNEQESRARQTAANLVPGRVAEEGMQGGGGVLHDEQLNLHGTPDYVLTTDDGPVPVEVKTGRTPSRPYASHVMQVAAYLQLLETSGQQPAHGLINYSDRVFRVAWDDRLRRALRDTLHAMAMAEDAGEADRDHKHVGRCMGCARRDVCTQKLA